MIPHVSTPEIYSDAKLWGCSPMGGTEFPSVSFVSEAQISCTPCPTPLYPVWPSSDLRTLCIGKVYELRGRDRGDMLAVGCKVGTMAGVRPTFAVSARILVQQPRTIFCIQLLSSLTKTIPLPTNLYVPNLAGSSESPAKAEIGATSGCRWVLVACISSNSMHWRTIW